MKKSNHQTRRFTGAVAFLLVVGTVVWALSQETVAAIEGAVAIGTAISTGEIPPDIATQIVKSLRKDQFSNAEIRDVFAALVDTSVPRDQRDDQDTGMGKREGRGMGAFVQDAHARGLKGRALADAIHQEQARRGIPGHAGQQNRSGDANDTDDDHRSDHGDNGDNDDRDTDDNHGRDASRGRSENKNRGKR